MQPRLNAPLWMFTGAFIGVGIVFNLPQDNVFPKESTNCKHCGRIIPLALEDNLYPRDVIARKIYILSLDSKIMTQKDIDVLFMMAEDTKDKYNRDTCKWIKDKINDMFGGFNLPENTEFGKLYRLADRNEARR